MTKQVQTSLGLLLVLVALALPAAAYDLNGFMPAAGEASVALGYTAEGYDEFYRGETRVPTPPALGEIDTRSFTLWFRYGVTDRLALVLNLPHVDTEGDGAAGFSESGLSDVTLLAKVRVIESDSGTVRHTLTGAGGLRAPVRDYAADAPVSIGDGSGDLLARLVYQVEGNGFYFSQQVGYDLRGDDVPDGIPLHSELGYTFGRTPTVNLFYTRYLADGGTDIGDAGFTFPSNQEEYERVGAKIYLSFGDGFGAALSGYTTLDGRNTGDASGVSLSGVFGF